MSDLYKIYIKIIAGQTVTALVTVVHPDAGTEINTKDFALQILINTIPTQSYWSNLTTEKDKWQQFLATHPHSKELDECYGLFYGKRIPVPDEVNSKMFFEPQLRHDFENQVEAQYGTKQGNYSFVDKQAYFTLRPNYEKFIRKAHELISQQPTQKPFTNAQANGLGAVYEFMFSVNDSSYLVHLQEGMEYGTAAFRLEN